MVVVCSAANNWSSVCTRFPPPLPNLASLVTDDLQLDEESKSRETTRPGSDTGVPTSASSYGQTPTSASSLHGAPARISNRRRLSPSALIQRFLTANEARLRGLSKSSTDTGDPSAGDFGGDDHSRQFLHTDVPNRRYSANFLVRFQAPTAARSKDMRLSVPSLGQRSAFTSQSSRDSSNIASSSFEQLPRVSWPTTETAGPQHAASTHRYWDVVHDRAYLASSEFLLPGTAKSTEGNPHGSLNHDNDDNWRRGFVPFGADSGLASLQQESSSSETLGTDGRNDDAGVMGARQPGGGREFGFDPASLAGKSRLLQCRTGAEQRAIEYRLLPRYTAAFTLSNLGLSVDGMDDAFERARLARPIASFGSPNFFAFLKGLPQNAFIHLARSVARYRRTSRLDASPSTIVSVNLCGCCTPHSGAASGASLQSEFWTHEMPPGAALPGVFDSLLSVMLVELHPQLEVVEFLDRRLPAVVRQQVGNRLDRNFTVQILGISFTRAHLSGTWTIGNLSECTAIDMRRLCSHPLYHHMLSDISDRQEIPIFRNLNLCPMQYSPSRSLSMLFPSSSPPGEAPRVPKQDRELLDTPGQQTLRR